MKKYIYPIFASLAMSFCLISCGAPSSSEHVHHFGTPTYEWAADYSSCTASRVCEDNAAHIEKETKESIYYVEKEATCETDGLARYVVTFEKDVFEQQSHDVILPAIGHAFGAPTYSWSDDCSSCTASRVCANDSKHVQSETVETTYETITKASRTTPGLRRYIATFTNPAFTSQSKEAETPASPYAPLIDNENGTVKYGIYPQNLVTDETLLTSLGALGDENIEEKTGWYLYNGNYYAKVVAAPAGNNYVFSNGDAVVTNNTYWFSCDEITWNILSSSNGEYYLLSSVLLDHGEYCQTTEARTVNNTTVYPNNYMYSNVRAWLNGYDGSDYGVNNYAGSGFLNKAFFLNEEAIKTSTVDNGASTTDAANNQYACRNTSDKVFLPSYQDYLKADYGFTTTVDANACRYCYPSDYARAIGAYMFISASSPAANCGWYWARSPYSGKTGQAWRVYQTGLVQVRAVNLNTAAMRPAIKIEA